jgi:hypothetical protein
MEEGHLALEQPSLRIGFNAWLTWRCVSHCKSIAPIFGVKPILIFLVGPVHSNNQARAVYSPGCAPADQVHSKKPNYQTWSLGHFFYHTPSWGETSNCRSTMYPIQSWLSRYIKRLFQSLIIQTLMVLYFLILKCARIEGGPANIETQCTPSTIKKSKPWWKLQNIYLYIALIKHV